MNWIEKALNLSPDAGTGATELAISVVVALLLAIAVTAIGRRAPGWRRR
jgi:hypothetical protein